MNIPDEAFDSLARYARREHALDAAVATAREHGLADVAFGDGVEAVRARNLASLHLDSAASNAGH